ncbi:unnamed protein product, partial [Effrenium voratum]
VGLQGATSGVHVAGSFQGWDPAATALQDADLDGIYETTLDIPAGWYEFKFINGSTWDEAEYVPAGCSEIETGRGNRYISVADAEDQEYHVCFGACSPCAELAKCKELNCPAGFALKAAALESVSDSEADCCEAIGNDLAGLVVRSAGWSDGNRAEFWLNGALLYATGDRGMTVVELLPDSTVKMTKTFDTYADSSGLEAYLPTVAAGNVLMLAAADEASAAFSPEAKSLVAEFGASQIQLLSYRSSYAFIGRKTDGNPETLAEVLLPEGGGHAVAVARISVAVQETPTCDMGGAAPPMSGTLEAGGNLLLEDCRYKVWQFPDAGASCVSGSWVVATGSSNALLTWNTLLMILAPAQAGEMRSGRFGGAHLLDAVVEDGVIIHYNTVRSSLSACIQSSADGGANETECRQAYAEALAEAPAPGPRRTRLTMFLSFFWARTATALGLVEASQAWATAEVFMLVQVVAWYVVCNGIKFNGCPRKNLLEVSEDDAIDMFRGEMGAVLDLLAPFCGPGGRAGVRGCGIATNSWSSPGATLLATFERFNNEITQAMAPRKTATFRYLDIFALGASMPEETLSGHGSQILQLWTWQALLGTFCTSPPTGQLVRFEGPLCWRAASTDIDTCKSYSQYQGTSLWQCMNSVLCEMKVEDAETTEMTTTSLPLVFEPVDGGEDRACRGENAGDNRAEYYTVISATLENCKQSCLDNEACVGVEYSSNRCELWTRPNGIGSSIALASFLCLRLADRAAPTTTTASTTTLDLSVLFEPVDGGSGHACRGATASDNRPEYYYVISGIYALYDCQDACVQAWDLEICEHSHRQRPAWASSIAPAAARFGLASKEFKPASLLLATPASVMLGQPAGWRRNSCREAVFCPKPASEASQIVSVGSRAP